MTFPNRMSVKIPLSNKKKKIKMKNNNFKFSKKRMAKYLIRKY